MSDNLELKSIGHSLVTEQAFTECLLELEKFYGKELSDFARLAYKTKIGECRDIDNAALFKATLFCIGKHSAGGKFFPSAEKIIEYAVGTPEERVAKQSQKALPPSTTTIDIEQTNHFFARFRQLLNKSEKCKASVAKKEDIEERTRINRQTLEKWEREGVI